MVLLQEGRRRQAARALWPFVVQNEWTEKIWSCLENHRYLAIMGHGSSSKTFTCAMWFLLDWWTNPLETAVVVTSDTVPSMRRRIWSDIKFLKEKARIDMGGILVDSKCMIQYSAIDEKHTVAGVAAESDNAQSKIQGLHTKFIRVCIDEADNALSRSIWGAIANLGTSGDMQVVALANPIDRFSDFGQHCEPQGGWGSINPESDYEWKSRSGWHVLRLDGLRSPNILRGKDEFPFLLTNKGMKDIEENEGTNSREYWRYVRAFYAPEGTITSIFNTEILEQCRKPITWYSHIRRVAACDPAFEGGDHCIVCLGTTGRQAVDAMKVGIQVDDFITIQRKDMQVPITIDYGNQIIELLKANQVEPDDFCIDSSGVGLGLSDYIKHVWGGTSLSVNFSGSPTEMKILAEDSAKASDRFDRFVSELWFVAREWCKAGLVYLKNPPRELLIDLQSRIYNLLPKNKIKIEPKDKMKARGLLSPDRGDAFCLLIHLVRLRSHEFMPSMTDKKPVHNPMEAFRKNATVWRQTYGINYDQAPEQPKAFV